MLKTNERALANTQDHTLAQAEPTRPAMTIKEEIARHLPGMRAYVRETRKRLGNDDLDEVVHEAVAAALVHRDTFEAGTNLGPELFARLDEAIKENREEARLARARRRRLENASPEWMIRPLVRPADRTVFLSQFREKLASLPEQAQRVLTLIEVEGYTFPEAASILELSLGTTHRLFQRARAHLAAACDAHSPFFRAPGAGIEPMSEPRVGLFTSLFRFVGAVIAWLFGRKAPSAAPERVAPTERCP